MKAQQLIQEQIEKLGEENEPSYLIDVRIFLSRGLEGINNDVTISERQMGYIINEISWYSTPGSPRAKDIGSGIPGRALTLEAHRRFLRCPNTVNSFVTVINGMRSV